MDWFPERFPFRPVPQRVPSKDRTTYQIRPVKVAVALLQLENRPGTWRRAVSCECMGKLNDHLMVLQRAGRG